MKPIETDFKDLFEFVRVRDDGDIYTLIDDPHVGDDKIVLNCSKKDSKEMKKLLRLIGEVRKICLERMPRVPRVYTEICKGLLATERKQKKFRSRKDFQDLVQQSTRIQGDEAFDLLLDYFDESGEVRILVSIICS
jgi:hypothetical protein